MILGYVVFMVAISGIMMNILFLASNNDSGYYDDDEDDQSKIHVTLSACILAGIVLLLIATFLSFRFMGTCCRYQGYNQRMTQTYPTTVGTTQYYQGQTTYSQGQTAHGHSTVPPPVFSTGGFNQSSNPPPYPVSQSYGIGSQQPPAYGFEGMGQQQPPAYGFEGMGQQQQPPAYGFQQTNTPTAPPPAYPY
ncbi:uncharacterized protein LOC128557740 [Mercenaria mercenaria]|uniref:uncharacterized protein LOC128557740 n=1 Tax=Mercenaria mercenaria TaxID=6596 RepID=UPI00234EE235|nr:uncharacterized protein LOC128557740 [Mercenaria mercenaria]